MDHLIIAGRTFSSRLLIGTGKYPSNQIMAAAHEASGAEIVTVAVRRVNVTDRSKESLLDYIDPKRYFLCPIPRRATPPTMRFAPRGWRAKRACRTGSSSK